MIVVVFTVLCGMKVLSTLWEKWSSQKKYFKGTNWQRFCIEIQIVSNVIKSNVIKQKLRQTPKPEGTSAIQLRLLSNKTCDVSV